MIARVPVDNPGHPDLMSGVLTQDAQKQANFIFDNL